MAEKNTTKTKATQTAAKARAERLKSSRAGSALGGFMEFVRTQGVVGLAVGLAIGTQAGLLVKSIVESIITPLVDLIVGKGGLSGLTWYVEIGDRSALFDFGALINALIIFLAVAFVIYFVVMGLKLDKLDKKKD
jgi:large conductance mechanosensitive channel